LTLNIDLIGWITKSCILNYDYVKRLFFFLNSITHHRIARSELVS